MVDSVITLHPSDATDFTSMGLGTLGHAIRCEAVEAINGEYELELDYPIDGPRYNDIQLRRIIEAKTALYKGRQPYRIYDISVPINGVITVYARHISYDLDGATVSPFVASGSIDASLKLNDSFPKTRFTITSEVTKDGEMVNETPTSVRYALGGGDDSFLSTYGGEIDFDVYNVTIKSRLGASRGVTVAYGKNLTDLNQDSSCSDVYNALHPFWVDNEYGVYELPDKIVKMEGDFNYTRVLPVDFSDIWEEPPTVEQMIDASKLYMKANNFGVPAVHLEVSFVPLSQTKEYEGIALLEQVNLGDTVNVYYPKAGITASARCIRTVFNVLTGRYISMELGETKAGLASIIVDQSNQIEQAPDIHDVEHIVNDSTKLITGSLGGYVSIRSVTEDGRSDPSGQPSEILIMNTPDINTATQVWRWNKNGLGYSGTGYSGPYTTAITSDGQIVADFITAGTMGANVLKAGIIRDKQGKFQFNLDTGEIQMDQLTVFTNFMNDILTNGPSKLSTGLGLTIGNTSIDIFKVADPNNPTNSDGLTNSLNEKGMYVIRAKGTKDETIMLQADNNGVIAHDLKAKHFLIVDDLIRFSRATIDDTLMVGCYWLGD